MFFAKKQASTLLSKFLFIFSYGFLVSFFTMIFGERLGYFEQGLGNNLVGVSFILGMILGFFLEKAWERMKGVNKELLTCLVLFLSTAFFTMVALAVGATLGGTGTVNFDWAGLGGYESVGLVLGCLGAYFGCWIASRAFFPASKKHAQLLMINGAVLLLLLFLGDQQQNPNLSSLSVFALPAMTVILHYGFKF